MAVHLPKQTQENHLLLRILLCFLERVVLYRLEQRLVFVCPLECLAQRVKDFPEVRVGFFGFLSLLLLHLLSKFLSSAHSFRACLSRSNTAFIAKPWLFAPEADRSSRLNSFLAGIFISWRAHKRLGQFWARVRSFLQAVGTELCFELGVRPDRLRHALDRGRVNNCQRDVAELGHLPEVFELVGLADFADLDRINCIVESLRVSSVLLLGLQEKLALAHRAVLSPPVELLRTLRINRHLWRLSS